MAALKGYFDDSGDPTDMACNSCSFAGYVGTVDSWTRFETDWREVLRRHGAPYLHMSELSNPSGPLGKFFGKQGEEERGAFLGDLIEVIRAANLSGFGAVVRVADLKRFNSERGLKIHAISLAVYACMIELHHVYLNETIEIVIDRIDKPYKRIDEAVGYAKTFPYDDVCQHIGMRPLNNSESFRDVLPIQAADFAAWEIRKYHETNSGWFADVKPGVASEKWHESHVRWFIGQMKSFTWPNYRKSYGRLLDAAHLDGGVWDYQLICEIDKARAGAWAAED